MTHATNEPNRHWNGPGHDIDPLDCLCCGAPGEMRTLQRGAIGKSTPVTLPVCADCSAPLQADMRLLGPGVTTRGNHYVAMLHGMGRLQDANRHNVPTGTLSVVGGSDD